jgi:hypothetical protein
MVTHKIKIFLKNHISAGQNPTPNNPEKYKTGVEGV